MKKSAIASLLLCLILCSSCADGKSTAAETQNADNTQTTEAVTEVSYIDNLPADLDFGGYEVRIFGGGSLGIDAFDITSEETADIVKDAIYRRRNTVEDRLNVTITPLTYDGNGWDVFVRLVTATVMSGADDYDALWGNMWWAASLSLDGMLYNLHDAPYLELDAPWWATDYINGLAYKDNIYWLTGPITTDWTDQKMCNFVNLDLWRALYPDDDIYEIVNAGQWTLERLNGFISEAYQDLNGSGVVDEGDRFGFINESDQMVELFAYACGVEVAPFNDEGVPTLTILDDPSRLISFWGKMYPIRTHSYCLQVSTTKGNTNTQCMEHFMEGNILFTPGFLFNTSQQLRDMENDYGVLPMPKLDETQENYISVSKDSIPLYGLPKTVSENGRDAALAVLEASAAEGYKNVTPVYFENALKNKYLRDERSVDIINMMSENPVSDFGAQYLDLGFHSFMRNQKKESIASSLENRSKVFVKNLDKMLKALESED